MKIQKWTLALVAAGVVCPGALVKGEDTPHLVQTQLAATTLSGFVDTSAIWQTGDYKTDIGRSNDGADRQDGFNLNAIGIVLDKPVSEEQWGAGYKVEFLDGPDVNNQFTIHNAFAKLRVPVGNGLVFKVGEFSSVAGLEYIEGYKNPNFSHSYGYYLEPGRQTGILADYKVCDVLAVTAGVSDAYNVALNARPYTQRNGVLNYDESNKTVMGALDFTAPESFGFLKGADLYTTIVHGTTGVALNATPFQGRDKTEFYIGATLPTPIKGLSTILTYDYMCTDPFSSPGQANYQAGNYANATGWYVIYKATEKFTIANRVDYATGTPYMLGDNRARTRGDELMSETLTLSYSLWANVLTRAEMRFDHDLTGRDGGPAAFGGGAAGSKDALSFALNVVYTF